MRRNVVPTPELCLQHIQASHPHILSLDTHDMHWVTRCVARARHVLAPRGWGGVLLRGDEQAIQQYGRAIAVGYYRLDSFDASIGPMRAVDGSDWTDEQLHRMRNLGRKHGRQMRDMMPSTVEVSLSSISSARVMA